MKLQQRTILVTGGAGGIGLELARQLLARGNTVIVTGRDAGRIEEARRRLPGLHGIVSDVADPASIEALHREVTATFPALDVLVN
ncbi:MAG: SDR family NAD(P)-dependent oxidoreductase, partial [Caulobacter sp.]|nr:SDR family NAD(P)-dependent oxidoreductase [Vitreoscilla sp.]